MTSVLVLSSRFRTSEIGDNRFFDYCPDLGDDPLQPTNLIPESTLRWHGVDLAKSRALAANIEEK